jgi:hypothetical protein
MLLSSVHQPGHPIVRVRAWLRPLAGCFLYRLGHLLRPKLTFFLRRGRKERYPIFINMSRQQYHNERARVLRKLNGKNFKTLRDHNGLTIEQVAEPTDIPIPQLKKLEAGRQNTPKLELAGSAVHYINNKQNLNLWNRQFGS